MEDLKPLECVLCGDEILPQVNPKDGKVFWKGGHNPAPLADEGKCCNWCNKTLVLAARIKATMS